MCVCELAAVAVCVHTHTAPLCASPCRPSACSIAAQPDLKPLRAALATFLRRSVGPWLAAKEPAGAGSGGLSAEQLGELLRRLRGAERALAGGG